jgi:peptidyl-prolyl cis-trans isomerase SurA
MKIVIVIVSIALFSSSAPHLEAQVVNGIAVIVNDAIITQDDALNYAAQAWPLLERQYGAQPEVLNQKKREALKEGIEKLVENKLILYEFKTAGYNLPESYIDQIITDRIQRQFGDRVRLTKSLQAQGITYETFRQEIRDQFIIEQMRRKNLVYDLIISPFKIEHYYETHQDEFKLDDQVKLRMIFLDKAKHGENTEKLAREIRGKLEAGVSFAEMASVYSDGSQSTQGGDWGWVERKVLNPELNTIAFSLKAGERSGAIEQPEGYYLMLVEEVRTAHLKPLSEVRDEIEKAALAQERARLNKKWIDRLRAKSFIRYFLPVSN